MLGDETEERLNQIQDRGYSLSDEDRMALEDHDMFLEISGVYGIDHLPEMENDIEYLTEEIDVDGEKAYQWSKDRVDDEGYVLGQDIQEAIAFKAERTEIPLPDGSTANLFPAEEPSFEEGTNWMTEYHGPDLWD